MAFQGSWGTLCHQGAGQGASLFRAVLQRNGGQPIGILESEHEHLTTELALLMEGWSGENGGILYEDSTAKDAHIEATRADRAAVATELAQARDQAVRRANRKRALVRLVQESTETELDKLIQNTMHLNLQEVADEMRVRIELRTRNCTGTRRRQ